MEYTEKKEFEYDQRGNTTKILGSWFEDKNRLGYENTFFCYNDRNHVIQEEFVTDWIRKLDSCSYFYNEDGTVSKILHSVLEQGERYPIRVEVNLLRYEYGYDEINNMVWKKTWFKRLSNYPAKDESLLNVNEKERFCEIKKYDHISKDKVIVYTNLWDNPQTVEYRETVHLENGTDMIYCRDSNEVTRRILYKIPTGNGYYRYETKSPTGSDVRWYLRAEEEEKNLSGYCPEFEDRILTPEILKEMVEYGIANGFDVEFISIGARLCDKQTYEEENQRLIQMYEEKGITVYLDEY